MDNRTISEIRKNETKLINDMKVLEQENQILKDKVQDLQADYGTQAQIERDMLKQENKKYKAQQKEFIKYLENEINPYKELADNKSLSFANGLERYETLEEILLKYKEIIGNNSDVTR